MPGPRGGVALRPTSDVAVPASRRKPASRRGPASGPAEQADIDTPAGRAGVVLEIPEAPRVLLMVGHGAGGDIDAPDLVTLKDVALAAGIAVARVRQPYRVAGRRAPAPARQLDAAWVGVAGALRDTTGPFAGRSRRIRDLPLVATGRSSGARVACRTASDCGAAAVLALAFPLHPPGRPDKSRAAELEIAVPLLVVQGGRDAFGKAAEFPSGVRIFEVDGADHGLKSSSFQDVAARAVAWISDVVDADR